MVKLNLGAGDTVIDGYTPIDRKFGQEVFPLPGKYVENSIDEIRASHVFEHFPYRQCFAVLKHWVSRLKPGGIIKIAVPDFNRIIEPYTRGEKTNVLGYLFGGQIDDNDFHKATFDKTSLSDLMTAAGLRDLTEWKSEINDAAALPVSLNIQGRKPLEGETANPIPSAEQTKIAAVMSMPRLAFTDNLFSAIKAIVPLGIPLDRGCGVFWGQVLTRQMEKHLDDGTEWILVVDYDTWFTKNHVIRMCQLMAENAQIDALCPVQCKREEDLPLIGISGPANAEGEVRGMVADFQKPLYEVVTAHFGLTLIRVAALKRMAKPWFQAVPDPTGGWGKGRQDEDIYFWNNFRRSGCRVFQANEVFIGHMQQVCTFSGLPRDNWRPIHVYMNDLIDKGPPPHGEPKIELLKQGA